ncbi:MAG: ferrochelatase [Candidatus Nanopelagicales bacterium]
MTFDAILIASYGGPESQEEVIPFLQRATAGRGIPVERLEEVGEHYRALGGVSPINAQNRALIAALEPALAARGIDLPVKLGNRNSQPFLADSVRELHAAGARNLLALATSVYSSYSSCRQYREDLARALAETGLTGEVTITKARPLVAAGSVGGAAFTATNAELLIAAVEQIPAAELSAARIMFTTHSIPHSMARSAGPQPVADPADNLYTAQHLQVARECLAELATAVPAAAELPWSLVYQSRSGPPQMPWLEPDVNDAIRQAAAAGTRHIVLAPIGFISDHVEVIWDLDNEAAATAAEVGVELIRVPTVGTHPRFVAGLADLVEELVNAPGDEVAAVGLCSEGCCLAPTRPGRPGAPPVGPVEPLPTVAGVG